MSLAISPVDKLYEEQKSLLAFLSAHRELSYLTMVTDLQRKSLLLGIASFFEHRIQTLILSFVRIKSANDESILSLLKIKAVDRQYHTYFDWRGKNANSFFVLFGTTFSEHCKSKVKNSADLEQSVRAFLELGNLRNELVHSNFATYPLEKTAEEIYALYQLAVGFVDWFEETLSAKTSQV